MGATQSSTETSTDIATSVISNIATSVVNKNTTTVNSSNDITAECTDVAFTAAVNACSIDTRELNKLIATASPETQKILIKSGKPSSCSMCSLQDVNLDTNVAINVSAINNNKIADEIKNELTSKLEQMVKNKTEGGIGLTDSQVTAITKLKTYVETNFDTKLVNETLNNYTFTQTLNAKNQNISRVNMKLTGTVLGATMIDNAIKRDANVKTLIDAAVTTSADTSGFNIALFGSIGGGLIFFVFMIFIAYRFFGFNPFSRSNNTQPQIIVQPINIPIPMNPYQQPIEYQQSV